MGEEKDVENKKKRISIVLNLFLYFNILVLPHRHTHMDTLHLQQQFILKLVKQLPDREKHRITCCCVNIQLSCGSVPN